MSLKNLSVRKKIPKIYKSKILRKFSFFNILSFFFRPAKLAGDSGNTFPTIGLIKGLIPK